MSPVDCIFLDPARRNEHGGKTVSIADCEPNVAELEDLLLSKASRIMIKLSPMLDLSLALKELKHTQEVHILSVNNECKELLILLGQTSPAEITIHCVNLFTKGTQEEQHFVFTREQEQRIVQQVTETLVNALQKSCSAFINASASEKHVLGITQEHSALESSTEPDMDSSATDYSGIDWDFAGG